MKKYLLFIQVEQLVCLKNQLNQVVTNDINPISLHKNIIGQYANVYEISPLMSHHHISHFLM